MIQIIIKYYKNIYYSLAVREYLVTVLYLLLSINSLLIYYLVLIHQKKKKQIFAKKLNILMKTKDVMLFKELMFALMM